MPTLASTHFLTHLQVADFVNAQKLTKANVLKLDTDSASGGWVLWYYPGGSLVKTCYARQYQRHLDLTDFINSEGLVLDDVLKIDSDPASGGWSLFWYE